MHTTFQKIGCLNRIVILIAVFSCISSLEPSFAHAFEVLVIKDSEIKPYRDAIEGFKSACNCSVKELEQDSLNEKFSKDNADAVYAVGTEAYKKAKDIKNKPVIYSMVMPSELADVSLNNVSGVSMDVSPEESLAAIVDIFPGVRRIGVISDPLRTGSIVEEAAAVARSRGIVLVVKTIRSSRQVPEILAELRKEIDVFWMLPDTTVLTTDTVDYLMLFSFQNNLPVFSFSKKYVELGSVAALSIDPYYMGVKAAEVAQELVQGKKRPFRLYAGTHRLFVNTKVASKIGVTISNGILKRAEKVE